MSSEQLPITERRDDPTTEEFSSEGILIRVRRQHCVDAMGPDESGMYEFHYDYDLFEFSLGGTTLHGRAYSDEPDEAHFLTVEVAGNRDLLTSADLQSPLAQAAIRYFHRAGRTSLTWHDSENSVNGYSPIP